MRGNTFGKLLSMTSFGESHGPAMGVVIDGIPSGLNFSLENLQKELKRRAPGQSAGTTDRKEEDFPEVLSGVFEGKTLGTPLAILVRNHNQRSEDYQNYKNQEMDRPGHADQTTMMKYGIRDHRGGGRSSGRETVARVIGGYCASLIIPKVKVKAYASQIGPFKTSYVPRENLGQDIDQDFGPYHFPGQPGLQRQQDQEIEIFLKDCKSKGESVGGKVQIIVDSTPVGLGEPAFDKLKADLAKGLLSIGACTSFSYGLGEEFATSYGSEVSHERENFGGVEGGISNGGRMIMQISFKPPSTVGEKAKAGRHDPCVIPRAIPVVESMVKFVLADHYLRQRAYLNQEQGQWF